MLRLCGMTFSRLELRPISLVPEEMKVRERMPVHSGISGRSVSAEDRKIFAGAEARIIEAGFGTNKFVP